MGALFQSWSHKLFARQNRWLSMAFWIAPLFNVIVFLSFSQGIQCQTETRIAWFYLGFGLLAFLVFWGIGLSWLSRPKQYPAWIDFLEIPAVYLDTHTGQKHPNHFVKIRYPEGFSWEEFEICREEKPMIPINQGGLEGQLYLLSSETFPHNPTQTFSCPVLRISNQGTIIDCNEAYETWLGYKKETLLGLALERICKTCSESDFIKKKFIFIHTRGQERKAFLAHNSIEKNEILLFFLPFEESVLRHAMLESLIEKNPLPSALLYDNGKPDQWNFLFQELFGKHIQQDTPFLHKSPLNQSDLERWTQTLEQAKQKPGLHTLSFSLENRRIQCFVKYETASAYRCFVVVAFLAQSSIDQPGEAGIEVQKWQTLGKLAGSVAHDFNNILTAILGFCDLMLQKQTPEDPFFTDLTQIKQSAIRATNLVKQLLFFSRQSPLENKPFNIQDSLREISLLLRRLIGEKIDLKLTTHETDIPLYVAGNQGQFEQVILNLAINARDAMPSGGELTFSTRLVQTKQAIPVIKKTLPAGNYCVVSIQDTGVGIAEEFLPKIFDLFFSTKAPGKGTGLGLATSYDIISAMHGGVTLETQVGKGTQFELFLPICSVPSKLAEPQKKPLQSISSLKQKTAHILFVEDEDPVRLFGSRALKTKGYHVLEAREGKKALEILYGEESMDLIISDVMMPGIDGIALATKALAFNPQIKILFVSGYAEELISKKLSDFQNGSISFLQKPFSIKELSEMVEKLLESKK